jgi:SAM-dependent methyltransferase
MLGAVSIRDVTRRARRRMAKLIFDSPESKEWDHVTGQRYEIENARQTIIADYPKVRDAWDRRAPGALPFSVDDQWFCGNARLFAEFADGIDTKVALEIGAGPFGALAPCNAFRRRIIIDPLGEQYRDIQFSAFGSTFFTPDIELHSIPAEREIAALVGAVDGLIVCRNCIDHCEDSLTILLNISRYARPGCWFLFWSDLWNLRGHDEGHRNITQSPDVIEALVAGLGFEILQLGRPIRNPKELVEWGCVARKK